MSRQQLRLIPAAVLAVAAAVSGPVRADSGPVQFAADMVRRAPDGQVANGRMFAGDGRLRLEIAQKGQELVRISDQKGGKEIILFPAEKTYLERSTPPAPAGQAGAPPPASAETDPCTRMQGMTCRRAGTEEVNGRPAVKWELSMTDQGKTLTGTQWLDVERGLPVRQVLPDGLSMELKLVGKETLDGRAAEKWELTATAPNQPPRKTFQWYDPELRLAVREEFPGGYVSELKNIKIGPQPDDLFRVPAGYSPKAVPPPGAKPPQGQ